MRPVVHTRKHYTQVSLSTLTAGNAVTFDIIDSVAVANKNAPDEVTEGAIVSAVYFEFWLTTDDAAAGTAIVTVEKIPAGAADPTTTNMAALDTYPNKKNVFYTTMGLTNPELGVAIPIVKSWIRIPKSKRRFGLGDKFVITFFAQTGTMRICGFNTYKEQM